MQLHQSVATAVVEYSQYNGPALFFIIVVFFIVLARTSPQGGGSRCVAPVPHRAARRWGDQAKWIGPSMDSQRRAKARTTGAL